MIFQQQLRIPGPTPLPERVTRAMARPMLDHRGPEFGEVLRDVIDGAKRVFETSNDLLLLTSSGSGGLESAVANVISPGDQVVAAGCGMFGDRLAGIAEAFGAEVIRLLSEWGQPTDPDDLAKVLSDHPRAGVVLLTHNETSTCVGNDIASLARVVRDADRISLIDAVSSVSSVPIEVDKNQIDVCVSASQKGWMAPPGVAFVTIGERAWALNESARAPRYYFDWKRHRDLLRSSSTPWTPAISVVYGVQEGIRMLEEEGLPQVYRRHADLAGATQAGLSALGFELFAAEGYRSHTVTGALPLPGLDLAAFRTLLRQRYGVVVGNGQGKMEGRMFRVGHLGAISAGDVVQVLWSIEQALEEMDLAPADGRGVQAASSFINRSARGGA
ncbi:MAG TPA: alanine--glyoxylate aminotransferase family protein [Candidatus Nitrosotalea sp.]|nr:alanine--glyoxylate aminotransferase family protein [Candidatus Nitrosotalea sp.]